MFKKNLPTHITRNEIYFAQFVLYVAIGLQVSTWITSGNLNYGPHPLIIITELALATIIGLSARYPVVLTRSAYRVLSFALLGLISAENISSIVLVMHLLLTQGKDIAGFGLLASALAIFLTNVIVFALWYWEIDSPGLTGRKWSKHDKDFQFVHQDMPNDFPGWHPKFPDYLYLSVTNAINFAPADTRPLTSQAKALMGTQAMVSFFTLALIIARSVSVLAN